jgi:hypothetical protein
VISFQIRTIPIQERERERKEGTKPEILSKIENINSRFGLSYFDWFEHLQSTSKTEKGRERNVCTRERERERERERKRSEGLEDRLNVRQTEIEEQKMSFLL